MPLKEKDATPPPKPLGQLGGPYARTSRKPNVRLGLKRQEIIEYMIAYPEATLDEVAVKFGCSQSTVVRGRQRAIRDGLVGPSYFDRTSDKGQKAQLTGDFAASDLEGAVRKILSESSGGALLSTEESLQAFTNLARAAERDGANKLSIEAHKAFHNLKSQSKEAKLGPGAPVSYDEKVERTSRILECVGTRALKAAFGVAFPELRIEITEKDPDAALYSQNNENGDSDALHGP
jgi:hypothetical protein